MFVATVEVAVDFPHEELEETAVDSIPDIIHQ
jgi:hypothetical protein